MPFYGDANVTSLWCKFPMQGCECKVYSWWCKYLLAEMRMQIFFFGYKMPLVGMPWCECPLVGMSWCECPLVGMSWCKCNLTKNFFYFSSRDFLEAWNQNAFNTRFIFLKDYSFLFRWDLNAECIIPAPKTYSILTLKLPKKWWSLLEVSEWDVNLRSDDSARKDLFSRFGWKKG